ncbi:MAG: phosphocholine cytidylyltransferase family protein, partial [Betaproteobacteria bacterium]
MNARAIILAAGRGSRMGALGGERPKCLVEVGGRTLLQRQLDALRSCGIADIAIVSGYRRTMVALPGVVEFHNERWAETSMVSSLACASDWLREAKCIVSYADIFYETAAVQSLLDCRVPLAITYSAHWRALWACRFDDPLSDAETFRLHADGTLAEIGGNPVSLEAIEGQYMGLLGFEPAGWSEVERIRDALPP